MFELLIENAKIILSEIPQIFPRHKPAKIILAFPLITRNGVPVPNFELANDTVATIGILTLDSAGASVPAPANDTFTAVSSNPEFLGVAISRTSGGNPALVLTPLVQQAQSITVTVSDSSGLTSDAQIVDIVQDLTPRAVGLDIANATTTAQTTPSAVGTPLVVTPATAILTGIGATVNITASDAANPTAPLTAVSSNTSSATVAPGANPGQFVVTSVAPGTATITVSDNAATPNTAAVQITVNSAISAPANVTLTGVNSTSTVSVSESVNPSATFTAVSSNPAVVTVEPGSSANQFVLTEVAAGSAVITITDNATPANNATIKVTAA